MNEYFRLSVEIRRPQRAWLVERLAQLGFPTFEEQPMAAATRLLIYDPSRERLLRVEQALARRAGLELPAGVLVCTLELAPRDWELLWTEYLEPVQLTPALTLYPTAAESVPGPGALYLEPAFAFGFGEHASTRLLARWVEERCRARPGCSLLDVGCGTGVLALVASKSGAGRVVGIDLSEPAVRAARANAERNALAASFELGSAAELGEHFDYVVANIEANVLLAASAGLGRCLASGSELALSGFIEEQAEELVQHYRSTGIALHRVGSEQDWCLLAGSVTDRR